jgi:hypothetical protein
MSLIGDIVGTVASVAVHAAIDTFCPEAELIPGLTNMVSNMVGQMLGQAVDQAMSQSGAPQFQINDVLDMLKKAVQGNQQDCDPSFADQIQNQFGGMASDMVKNIVDEFKDLLQQYKADQKNCQHGGGKGGAGGAGGSAGSSGPVTLRDLAVILGKLEGDEAKRVRDKVLKADQALQQQDQTVDPKASQADQDKANKANAQNKADQFQAMEESKAEAQIFQTLSSAISEVMKNFGGALQTAARGG